MMVMSSSAAVARGTTVAVVAAVAVIATIAIVAAEAVLPLLGDDESRSEGDSEGDGERSLDEHLVWCVG